MPADQDSFVRSEKSKPNAGRKPRKGIPERALDAVQAKARCSGAFWSVLTKKCLRFRISRILEPQVTLTERGSTL